MFNIIISMCLFMGISADVFGNGTKGLNCTEWPPSKLNVSWLCDDGYNTTRAWKCTYSPSNKSKNTLLIRVECEKLQIPSDCKDLADKRNRATDEIPTQQTERKWYAFLISRPFLYGAASGSGVLLLVVLILSIVYCGVKKRRRRSKMLNERAEVDSQSNSVNQNILSVNQETTQPLCDCAEDEDHCLTNVNILEDTQTESQHEVAAGRSNEPDYENVVKETGIPASCSTAIEEDSDIAGDGGDEKDTEDSTPFQKGDARKCGYQDIKVPTGQEFPLYENCEEGGRVYMHLLIENDASDDQDDSKTELPTASRKVDARDSGIEGWFARKGLQSAPAAKTGSAARPSSVSYINLPCVKPLKTFKGGVSGRKA